MNLTAYMYMDRKYISWFPVFSVGTEIMAGLDKTISHGPHIQP